VSLGSLWLLSLVASPSLSVASQQHYPLSPGGLKTPSTLLPSSAPQLTDHPHSFRATQPLSPPCSMHKAPGKGGCSQPAINLHTSCAYLGLAHHHTPPPPPSSLAIPTTIFLPGASLKRMPTLFTPTVLSQAIAHHCCFNHVHHSLAQHYFISTPH
jgi:hypothetical protein